MFGSCLIPVLRSSMLQGSNSLKTIAQHVHQRKNQFQPRQHTIDISTRFSQCENLLVLTTQSISPAFDLLTRPKMMTKSLSASARFCILLAQSLEATAMHARKEKIMRSTAWKTGCSTWSVTWSSISEGLEHPNLILRDQKKLE